MDKNNVSVSNTYLLVLCGLSLFHTIISFYIKLCFMVYYNLILIIILFYLVKYFYW